MRIRSLASPCSLLCLALLAAPASAEHFYATLESGISIVPDSDIVGGAIESGYDAGFLIGGALGMRIADPLRAEIAVNYRRAEADDLSALGATVSNSGDVGVVGAMANAYIDLDLGGPITPYLGGGIGLGVVVVDTSTNGGVVQLDDTSNEFAWNLMAGISFDVVENLSLQAGYRYFATTDATIDASALGSTGELVAEFETHEIVFGFRMGF